MSDLQRSVNEHANSMFRHETLFDSWIDSCAAYLRNLFKESLRGKTVIDYAFGRGNWSLAFLRAGADKVIAIDASSDNVSRFKKLCHKKRVASIDIITGNILEKELVVKGDLIWLYGILPNVPDQTTFLRRIKTLLSGADAQVYVYQFNAESLREFTVQTTRKILVYKSELEFLKDSFLFVRPARMRARDDLTAPHVKFSSATELQQLLRDCDIYIKRKDEDFQQYLHQRVTEDFYPHQFLCTLNPGDEIEINEPQVPYAAEVKVLRAIAEEVLSLPLTAAVKKNIALGLFNTHFAFLKDGVYAYDSVVEICLLLLYVLMVNGLDDSKLSLSVVPYYKVYRAALAGQHRSEKLRLISEVGIDDKLINYLTSNNVRS